MKYIKYFESININNKIDIDFSDIEDYFMDLFDENDQKWDIRVAEFFTGLKIHITKQGMGHAHRQTDKIVHLVKRNKIDTMVSNSIDRLASSKGMKAVSKTKRYRYHDVIGYSFGLI